MTPRSQQIEVAIFTIALILLGVIWAMNGYQDTWLFAAAALIAVPVSWLSFDKSKDR